MGGRKNKLIVFIQSWFSFRRTMSNTATIMIPQLLNSAHPERLDSLRWEFKTWLKPRGQSKNDVQVHHCPQRHEYMDKTENLADPQEFCFLNDHHKYLYFTPSQNQNVLNPSNLKSSLVLPALSSYDTPGSKGTKSLSYPSIRPRVQRRAHSPRVTNINEVADASVPIIGGTSMIPEETFITPRDNWLGWNCSVMCRLFVNRERWIPSCCKYLAIDCYCIDLLFLANEHLKIFFAFRIDNIVT